MVSSVSSNLDYQNNFELIKSTFEFLKVTGN